MEFEKPIEWVVNQRARTIANSPATDAILPHGISHKTRSFHNQIPCYKISPLKSLNRLAETLGLGGIWVKDESARLSLRSFKVLGSTYAIYQFAKTKLGMSDQELTYERLRSSEIRKLLGSLVFAAATDGNHGRGVAWAAEQLGFKTIIYVHKLTSQARIDAIRSNGADVVVVDGTYDDAVEKVNEDARRNGWQVISDTSWEGYEDIPRWVMQGYATLLGETQEQLNAQGIIKPTHIFAQAGVGSLAAAVIGYYYKIFGTERPMSVVVEPTQAACLYHSARLGDGAPHNFGGSLDTIMAGLACGDPNPLAWRVLWDTADVFAVCPDYVAAKGMRVYGIPRSGDPFIVSGESGAATLGALMFAMEYDGAAELKSLLGLGPQSQVLLINSEGNTDPDHFRRVVWEGGVPVPDRYKQFRQ